MQIDILKNTPKTSGIYCFENISNDAKYVGKANNLYKRLGVHLSELRRNVSECSYLQNAWNKHGEENFNFYVLEECDIEFLSEREIYYIEYLNTKRPNGYNLTNGGDGSIGYKHTKQALEKMRTNNANYGEKNGRSKLTKEMVFNILYLHYFKEYSIVDLEKKYGVSNVNISRIITGKNWKDVFKEFIEKYDYPVRPNYTFRNRGGENNPRSKITEKEVIKILKLYFIKKFGITKISLKLEIPVGIVFNVCKGRTWKFIYEKFIKTIDESR